MAIADIMHPFQISLVVLMNDEGSVINQVYAPFRGSGIFLINKGITVFCSDAVQYLLLAKNLHNLAVNIVQGAHVIQPSCMILVIVSQ